MSTVICPGSFDPVTVGHINIIKRATQLFDNVIVLVSINSSKKCAFSVQERVNLLKIATKDMQNVTIDSYDGLLADYAEKVGANALVKGLRAVTDYEYEFQLSLINKKLNKKLETLFMPCDSKYMYLSSSMVKEVAKYGGDISEFIPKDILNLVLEKLNNKNVN